MKKTVISTVLIGFSLLLSGYAHAQAFEAVYEISYESSSGAKAALDKLFDDEALRGNKVTLYANDFGVPGEASHTVVVDYDNYAARDKLDQARRESHGWANYVLAAQDAEVQAADLAIVVKDYGKPRNEAGYLVAFVMQVGDPGAYVLALDKLDKAVGNPGVLRLVALRSGPADMTHAVLIGAADFAAAKEYLDKLFTSDGYATFKKEVGDMRKIHNIGMYRRVGAWGY
jgi:hypothetical protein